MAETNNPTPNTNMQDAHAASDASSPMTTSPLFMHSSPPDADGDALMRAADTPMESSPAPSGLTVGPSKKRKRASGANNGDADDEEEEEDVVPKKKGKGKKGGAGKSVCSQCFPPSAASAKTC